jgi:hypothetical protein
VETLVGLFYAPSPDYPAWADKEWVEALKQNFTKYLLTISVSLLTVFLVITYVTSRLTLPRCTRWIT